jgi:hypothetical protein
MPHDKDTGPVTRRELYVAVGTSNLCSGLLALTVAAPADGMFRAVAPWILAVTGILTGFIYMIATVRRKAT